jgi:hypothetical protein
VIRGQQPGFHILASPPGEQAPIQHINYTPATQEVHQRGAMAPAEHLNYTLLPNDAVPSTMQGAGGGFSQGAGITGSPMGSGQGGAPTPPILQSGGGSPVLPGQERLEGRYGVPGSMASGQVTPGAPPARVGPYSTGPNPRIATSGPQAVGQGTRASMWGTTRGWGNAPGAGQGGTPTPDDTSARSALLGQGMSGGQNINDTAPTATATPTAVGADTSGNANIASSAAGPDVGALEAQGTLDPAQAQQIAQNQQADQAAQNQAQGGAQGSQTQGGAQGQGQPQGGTDPSVVNKLVASSNGILPTASELPPGTVSIQYTPSGDTDQNGNPLSDNIVAVLNDGTQVIIGNAVLDPQGNPSKATYFIGKGSAASSAPWYVVSAGARGSIMYNTATGEVRDLPGTQPVGGTSIVNAGSAGFMVVSPDGSISAIPGSQTTSQLADATAANTLAQSGYALTHPAVTSTGGGLLVPPGASVDVQYNPSPLTQPNKTVSNITSGGPLPQEARDIAAQDTRLANLANLPAAGTPPPGQNPPAAAAPAAPPTNPALPPYGTTAQIEAAQPSSITHGPSSYPTPPTGAEQAAQEQAQRYKRGEVYPPAAPFQPVPELPTGGGGAGAGQGFGDTGTTFAGRGLTPATGRGSSGVGWEPRLRLGAGLGVQSMGSPGVGQDEPWEVGAGHLGGRSSGMGGGRGGSGMSGGGGAGQGGVPDPAQSQMQANMMDPNVAGALLNPGMAGTTPDVPAILSPYLAQPIPFASDPEHSQPRPPMVAPAQPSPQQMQGAGQGGTPPPPTPGDAPPPGLPPGGWQPPVQQPDVQGIGHRFGQQMNVGTPQHEGVDLQASEGVPTQSPVDGFVTRVEHNPQGLGLVVTIQGKDGSEHQLGHLSHTDAYPGMQVAQGQTLGSVGSTGNTTGSHLHWGVKDQQGVPTDPTQALPPGMQNMPPVPGTQMMGPPGGTGGAAQAGAGQGNDQGLEAGWPIPPYGRSAHAGAGQGGAPAQDSGQHQGLTQSGQTYTISKPYAQMTPQEQDDANRYAHQMGSPAGGAPSVAATDQSGNPQNRTTNVEDANTRASNAEAQFQALLQAMVTLQGQAQSALNAMNAAGQSILQTQGQQAFSDFQTRQQDRLQLLQSALSSPWMGMLSGINPLPTAVGQPVVGGSDPWGLNNIFSPWDPNSWVKGSPYAPPPSNYGVAGTPQVGVDPNTNLPTIGWGNTQQGTPGGQGAQGTTSPPPTGSPGAATSQAAAQGQPGQTFMGTMQPAGSDNVAYPTGTASGQPMPSGAIGSNQSWGKQPQSWQDWQAMTPWQKSVYGSWFQNTYGPAKWNQEQNRLHYSALDQGASPTADITPLQAASADQATLAGDVMNANVMGFSPSGWQGQETKNWSAARAPAVKQAPGIAA